MLDSVDRDPENTLRVLDEIRDRALMLSLGNAYLCEAPFLKRIGSSIDSMLGKLKADILSLKRTFPGKFRAEIETDEILQGIRIMAQRLQKPDKEIHEKCTLGELGRELETHIGALARAINAIRIQVEGEPPLYTKTDAILGFFGKFKFLGNLLRPLPTFVMKLFILGILGSILVVAYLFVTIETEKDLLKEINKSKAYIQSQQETLLRLDDEKQQIYHKIESMREKELTRQDKIDIIGLNVRIQKLNEERHNIDVEMVMHERKIKENQKRIEEIKKKFFIQRLLRM